MRATEILTRFQMFHLTAAAVDRNRLTRPPGQITAEQRGWNVYDFAESRHSRCSGSYLTVLAQSAADAEGMVDPLGLALMGSRRHLP